MKRILVFGMTENPGGVESFLMSYYRKIDKARIQFDFLCNSHRPIAYEEEVLSLGARTFHITARSQNPLAYRKELEAVFSEHASEWAAVWVNVSSLANIDYLKLAKKYGIPRRIIHSHNSRNMDGKLRGLLHRKNRRTIGRFATDFWACSEDAARWFYREDLLSKSMLIRNAIDVGRVRFDPEKAELIRRENGLGGKFVIGNVGRLHFQKNQAFALEVFRKYRETNPESVLVFVGQGEDEAMLKEKSEALGLQDSVLFAGVQQDIQAWLSAFDLFLFPSVFEGLSIAALEAQANGLPVLASYGVIPEDVKMNGDFVFLPLGAGADAWAKKLQTMQDWKRPDFEEVKRNFEQKGFEIGTAVKRLEKLLEE